MKSVYIGVAITLLTAIGASAANSHGDWTAAKQKDGRCVAMTTPSNSVGGINGRNAPYVAVMNSPAEGIRGAVSLVSGSDKTGGGTVKIDIDGKNFDALPFRDAAFVGSGKPEADLIASMQKSERLTVRWATKDGESVADTYSLKGFGDAYKEIENCK